MRMTGSHEIAEHSKPATSAGGRFLKPSAVGVLAVLATVVLVLVLTPGEAPAGGLGAYDAGDVWVGAYDVAGPATAVVYVEVDGLAAEFVYEDDDTLGAPGRIEFVGANCTGAVWGVRNPDLPPHTGLAQPYLITGQPLYLAAAEASETNVTAASWMQEDGVCVNYGMPANPLVVPLTTSAWTEPSYPLIVRLDAPFLPPAVSGLGAAAVLALAGGLLIFSWSRLADAEGERAA